jgi:hypothetical protein
LKNSEEAKLSRERGEDRQLHTHQVGIAHQNMAESQEEKYSYKPTNNAPDIPQNTIL